MRMISVLIQKLKKFFSKKKVNSTEEVHWVNHIFDETVTWPNSALMWINVHGFDEGPGQTYWVGLDGRSFGIRIADYIVKCKNKAIYDEYINFAKSNPTKFLYKMREDARMNCCCGDDVNIEFIFKWGGEEKTFDVHLSTDSYATQK